MFATAYLPTLDHVLMRKLRNEYILVGNLKGRDHLKDLDVHARIILKWIIQKQSVRLWTGFIWLRIGSIDGLL
jgi:hypothetical protein